MYGYESLLKPQSCAVLLIDCQTNLTIGMDSMDRRVLQDNLVALAKTAALFKVPAIASIPAAFMHSNPLIPEIQTALPFLTTIERRSMNLWEDDVTRNAVLALGCKRLIVAGFLTEASISFPVLSAILDGFEVFVVGDACGGVTATSHDMALGRMHAAGAQLTSWLQVLLEFQRDWRRHATHQQARAIMLENGADYRITLASPEEVISPSSIN